MGPKAKDAQWKKPITEFCNRAQAIGSVHAPISISTYLYNISCVSLLLYVSQVCTIPKIVERAERNAIHQIWHFATNALTTASYLHLHNVGAPKIRSVISEIYATQLRTAWRFKDVWQSWLEQIKNTTDCYGNLITVARDELTPDFWDHPPIAQILAEAWHGTPLELIKAEVAASVKSKINLVSVENPDVSREGPKNKITVQKWAYPEFLRLLYPEDLAIVLQRRLQKMSGSNLTRILYLCILSLAHDKAFKHVKKSLTHMSNFCSQYLLIPLRLR